MLDIVANGTALGLEKPSKTVKLVRRPCIILLLSTPAVLWLLCKPGPAGLL